jgi:hypothetical protein
MMIRKMPLPQPPIQVVYAVDNPIVGSASNHDVVVEQDGSDPIAKEANEHLIDCVGSRTRQKKRARNEKASVYEVDKSNKEDEADKVDDDSDYDPRDMIDSDDINEGDDDLYEDNPDGEDDDVITKKRNFGKGQRRKR